MMTNTLENLNEVNTICEEFGNPIDPCCCGNQFNEEQNKFDLSVDDKISADKKPRKSSIKIEEPCIKLLDYDEEVEKFSIYDHVTGFTSRFAQCNTVQPLCKSFCCGPSLVQPIFDDKIRSYEKEIVKYCNEIEQTNSMIRSCCSSKYVVDCQRHALHNVIFKICLKVQELENQLYGFKMFVCCRISLPNCSPSSGMNCREHINEIRRIEDRIETLHNGILLKKGLLESCQTEIQWLKDEKEKYKTDVEEIKKIENELQQQLQEISAKMCNKTDGKRHRTFPNNDKLKKISEEELSVNSSANRTSTQNKAEENVKDSRRSHGNESRDECKDARIQDKAEASVKDSRRSRRNGSRDSSKEATTNREDSHRSRKNIHEDNDKIHNNPTDFNSKPKSSAKRRHACSCKFVRSKAT